MAIVFQDFPKYETSIKDNIIVSCKDNAYTDKELNDICQETGLKDIIGNFPLGINEEVGLFSEYGRNLSGGEWQRIALARAAIRRNTGIMILDEPTSALDPKAESNIYDKFSRISKEKTTVLVTHRLGAIKLVDRIIVFKDGRIVEEGNHDALMKKNGVYSEMYRAQARWYK